MSDHVICPACGEFHKDDLHEYFDTSDETIMECARCEAHFVLTREVRYTVGDRVSGPNIPDIPEGYRFLIGGREKMIPASSRYCAPGDKEWTPLGFRTWPKDNLLYIVKEGDG